jgi:hypothetical protein
MKTDDLIDLLARDAGAVKPGAVRRRYGAALASGAFGAALLMALWLGVRPDIAAASELPMFWLKLLFPATLIGAGLVAVSRLARPGAELGLAPWALLAPLLAVWLMGAMVLLSAPPAAREALVFGSTSDSCPLSIALLSLPALVAILWATGGLAPTRLALAGAASGLLAGAVGALVYALHCTEMAAPFLAIWYVLGILIPAAAGAMLGPRLLRW